MIHLILYEDFLTVDNIFTKHYSEMKREIFDKIVTSDPTTIVKNDKIDKLGTYSKWLLKLFKNKNLKLEDLYKATKYLSVYDKLKQLNKTNKKDIYIYNSIQDLYKDIKPFIKNEQFKSYSKKEVYERCKVASFNGFDVFIPTNKKEAIILSRNTEWCTGYDDMTLNNYYADYTMFGPLIILMGEKMISLYDSYKVQLHGYTEQYMDESDYEIDISKLLNSDKEFFDWYKQYMSINLLLKYNLPINNCIDAIYITKYLKLANKMAYYKEVFNDPDVILTLKNFLNPLTTDSEELRYNILSTFRDMFLKPDDGNNDIHHSLIMLFIYFERANVFKIPFVKNMMKESIHFLQDWNLELLNDLDEEDKTEDLNFVKDEIEFFTQILNSGDVNFEILEDGMGNENIHFAMQKYIDKHKAEASKLLYLFDTLDNIFYFISQLDVSEKEIETEGYNTLYKMIKNYNLL
jgi:hypothetical protein